MCLVRLMLRNCSENKYFLKMVDLFIISFFQSKFTGILAKLVDSLGSMSGEKNRPPSFYLYRLLLSILCVLGIDTHLYNSSIFRIYHQPF